jgi:hypothetical protein
MKIDSSIHHLMSELAQFYKKGKPKVDVISKEASVLNKNFGRNITDACKYKRKAIKEVNKFLLKYKFFFLPQKFKTGSSVFISHPVERIPLEHGIEVIIIKKMFFDPDKEASRRGFFSDKYPWIALVFPRKKKQDIISTAIHESVHALDHYYLIKLDINDELRALLFCLWLYPTKAMKRAFFNRGFYKNFSSKKDIEPSPENTHKWLTKIYAKYKKAYLVSHYKNILRKIIISRII